MIVDIREIPEDGIQLVGQIDRDIFELDGTDIQPDGPVSYDFQVSLVSESILVRGNVLAHFRMHCVRCLEPFRQEIFLADCIYNESIEGRSTIDLTDSIREDILLALPDHPHCDSGTPPQGCPMSGQFEKPEKSVESEFDDPADEKDVWADLEGFKPQRD